MVRAISDDSQLLKFGPVSQLLSGHARAHSERALASAQPEAAYRHRERFVSEKRTIRRPEVER